MRYEVDCLRGISLYSTDPRVFHLAYVGPIRCYPFNRRMPSVCGLSILNCAAPLLPSPFWLRHPLISVLSRPGELWTEIAYMDVMSSHVDSTICV